MIHPDFDWPEATPHPTEVSVLKRALAEAVSTIHPDFEWRQSTTHPTEVRRTQACTS